MKISCTAARFIILIAALCLMQVAPALADDKAGLSTEQTIYVPAYSHIYSGNTEDPFQLTVTLSIRNIDPGYPIKVMVVDYYQTQGKRLKGYLDKPAVLNPMESLRYVIPEKDTRGGSGANFIVKWEAARPVNPPLVETIMIGAQTQQGISFSSRGRVILPTD